MNINYVFFDCGGKVLRMVNSGLLQNTEIKRKKNKKADLRKDWAGMCFCQILCAATDQLSRGLLYRPWGPWGIGLGLCM